MKVALVFKNPCVDSPGACHQGLGITALNIALSLREQRIAADPLAVPNGEYLWQKLASDWSDYTHVVLSAPFIDAPFLRRLFAAFPAQRFAVCYHSNLGFLSQDRFAGLSIPQLMTLEAESHNFTLASNSLELSRAMQLATGKPLAWLPNLYHLPAQVRRLRRHWAPGLPLRLGLFGAARALKNWLTAGVAAMIVANGLSAAVELHVSHGRDEGSAATRDCLSALLALNPRVTLIQVPWLDHDDFLRYLYGIDLMLQPSFTETFNNVTADGCFCGVPSVVSDAIDWVPRNWIAKADSAVAIAATACELLRDKQASRNGWRALDSYNTDALKAWTTWLEI
jgi:hypothetical protein